MFRKHLAGQVAALGAGLMMLMPSSAAQAYDVPLPGERRMEVHGFYEGRLRAMGQDIPFGGHGASVSTFRHVLNVETDIEIFPDGVGPFDFMVGFTRWLVSYECVYERGCGLFPSMDNFGGDSRSVNREPRNFRHARTRTPYAGGVVPLTYRPGSLRTPLERITPSHRYRTITNPDGVLVNPFPLAAFANLNTRTALDAPIDGGTSVGGASDTRAGVMSFNPLVIQARLVSSRPSLDSPSMVDPFDADFPDVDGTILAVAAAQASVFDPDATGRDTFQRLNDESLFPRLDDTASDGLHPGSLFGTLSWAQRANRLKTGSGFLESHGVPVPFKQSGDDAAFDESVEAQIDFAKEHILGIKPDPNDPTKTIVVAPRTLDSVARALVFARPDSDNFRALAESNGALQLLTMKWGATRRADGTNSAWLATIDTPIRPLGYFTASSADVINEFGVGSVGAIASPAFAPSRTFTPGLDVSFYCAAIDGDADCHIPQSASFGDPGNKLIPRYLGPDADRNTMDDLPIDPGDDVHKLYLTENDQEKLGVLDGALPTNFRFSFHNGATRIPQVEVNGEIEYRLTEEGHPGPDGVQGTSDDGCIADGVNANGECILLMAGDTFTVSKGVLDPEAVFLGGDTRLRPGSALQEPSQLTGISTFVTGNVGLPARPRNPAGGLSYTSPGLKRFLDDNHGVVSGLDVDFTEDELRWEHGAGQDEHEFKEGYIEFEMMDSEIFARVGKLLWVWGKTELFRNQDRLNPIDIGLGALSRLEESRLGQWGFQVVYSPEAWMSVGPIEDMRMELVVVTDDYEPTDLGKCGEGLTFAPVCGLAFGAMAHGFTGIGVVGAARPDDNYSGLQAWDYGLRLEGRWDRFTFAVTDFWGWDDAFYIDLVQQYERRTDPFTGAPVNANGPAQCSLRREKSEVTGELTFVGPDGLEGSEANPDAGLDNMVASVGNCLLFDNPEAVHGSDLNGCYEEGCSSAARGCNIPDPTPVQETICEERTAFCASRLDACFERTGDDWKTSVIEQRLRAGDDIALSHTANQTLFHTICTLTFDQDNGFCAVDTLNSEALSVAIAEILSGGSLGELAILGTQTIRTEDDYSVQVSPESFSKATFAELRHGKGGDLGDMDFRRRSLLGCGESFGSSCGAGDEGILPELGQTGDTPVEGGVDFMNADAEVLTQEFTLLKVGSPFHLVGARGGQFAAGITVPGVYLRDDDGQIVFKDIQEEEGGAPVFVPVYDRAFNVNDAIGLVDGMKDAETDPMGVTAAHVVAGQTIRDAEGRYALSSDPNQRHGGRIDLSQGTGRAFELQVDLPTFDDTNQNLPNFSGREPLRLEKTLPTDFMIEPMLWPLATPESVEDDFDLGRIDERERNRLLQGLDAGLIFFQDMRIDPTQTAVSVNNLANTLNEEKSVDSEFFQLKDRFGEVIDPEKLEEFDYVRLNPFGENCSKLFGGPDPGCTDLELISQNFERLFIAGEIIGGDDVFDPPETFQEVVFMLDLDPSTDLDPFFAENFGDPISGRDGIVFNDFDTDGSGVADRKVVAVQGTPGDVLLDQGQGYYDCTQRSRPMTFCHETFGTDAGGNELASAMPIGLPGRLRTGEGDNPVKDVGWEDLLIKATELDPLDFQRLMNGERVLVHEADLNIDIADADGNPGRDFEPDDLNGDGEIGLAELFVKSGDRQFFQKQSNGSGDLNNDLQPDLDEDFDGVFDQLDDGSAGPISDDNILCGSGIPGDPLQEARQTEYVNSNQLVLEKAALGGEGLPKRSPVFCSSLVGLLGITGQTLPTTRAGGDGRYGRRDFLWHGGREVALNFQKRNTFGFSLDFAEDTTKSSWGFEFSWTADKLYGDTRSYTGLHSSDEYALTISVDRPTFFNFINPNRSFFINFQVNLRYFDDYVGGEDERDGMFGTAEGPLSAFMVLTFFTGYFQDRLNPAFNLIYDTGTGNGGVLSRVSYRWNERFSTALNLNHFFGHTTEMQGSHHPIALFGHPDTTGEITRGFGAVKNRDVAIVTVRYTF